MTGAEISIAPAVLALYLYYREQKMKRAYSQIVNRAISVYNRDNGVNFTDFQGRGWKLSFAVKSHIDAENGVTYYIIHATCVDENGRIVTTKVKRRYSEFEALHSKGKKIGLGIKYFHTAIPKRLMHPSSTKRGRKDKFDMHLTAVAVVAAEHAAASKLGRAFFDMTLLEFIGGNKLIEAIDEDEEYVTEPAVVQGHVVD